MNLVLTQGCGAPFETSPFRNFGEVSKLQPVPISPGFARKHEAGPTLAINRLLLRVAFLSSRSDKRGGARNHASRESETLTRPQLANLIAATRHAARIGLPFTRMITIHWQAAGVSLAQMAKATGRFVDLMSKALARARFSSAWLWVHEGGPRKGGHCHLLAHVPAAFVTRLRGLQMRWLRLISGRPYKAGVILSRPIGGRLGLESKCPELHAVNLEAALGYVLKGSAPQAAKHFGLQRLELGGRVIGRRCSTSQNIGRKAREPKV